MPRSKAIIDIKNIVASANLNRRVDLNALAKRLSGDECKLRKLPGLVFRFEHPKTATTIFGSGKILCVRANPKRLAKQ
jgi:transcription initiation factor TFIID TATA-box-binding protein